MSSSKVIRFGRDEDLLQQVLAKPDNMFVLQYRLGLQLGDHRDLPPNIITPVTTRSLSRDGSISSRIAGVTKFLAFSAHAPKVIHTESGDIKIVQSRDIVAEVESRLGLPKLKTNIVEAAIKFVSDLASMDDLALFDMYLWGDEVVNVSALDHAVVRVPTFFWSKSPLSCLTTPGI